MNKKGIVLLKELNVIKFYLSFLTFLVISQLIYSQSTLKGKYSSLMPYQEHYNYFKFSENGEFEYHSGASLGDDEFGKGHYQIKNDSLILNYDLTELKTNSFHKYKTYSNDSDSINLSIKVFDLSEKPRSNIEVYNSKDRYGVLTDKDGFSNLSFKKQAGSKKIEFSDICCGRHSFTIDTTFNYVIEVYLAEGSNKPQAIKDQIVKYQIIKNSKNKLKLKNGDQVLTLEKRL